jgi:hypothetical protein
MMWPTKSGHRDNAVNFHKVVNDDNRVAHKTTIYRRFQTRRGGSNHKATRFQKRPVVWMLERTNSDTGSRSLKKTPQAKD